MKNSLINTLVSAPIFYAIITFFLAELNIALWSEESRFWFVAFVVIVFFATSLYEYLHNDFAGEGKK